MIARFIAAALVPLLMAAAAPASAQADVALGNQSGGNSFQQTELVSDQTGAQSTDPHLVSPWGAVAGAAGPFWIADNGAGLASAYDGAGQPYPGNTPLVVSIAGRSMEHGSVASGPTGIVLNPSSDFVIRQGQDSAPAIFLFASQDGTISGWSAHVNANRTVIAVDNSKSGAGYTGLAIVRTADANFLLAANFHHGTVDVFDHEYQPATLPGGFADPTLPSGFAPFNVQKIGQDVYVTYAKQDAGGHGDVSGPGNGYINAFDSSGNFIRRVASGGPLNSPWGLAVAPSSFGEFANHLLVGNFGDGHINAYDLATTAAAGQLNDASSNPIQIPAIRGLLVGNGSGAGEPNSIYFTAGSATDQHGLFGSLAAADST